MDIGLVVFLILFTQTIISAAILGYYEFNIDMDEKKYGINTKHHDEYIGLIKVIEYDLNKIDFTRATKLRAFVYLMLLGLKYGILLNLGTLLSLIITIINITVNNFKNNNFNLHVDTDKLAVSEEDRIHYTYTKKAQKIKCSICGNKFIDKTSKREVYVCDVEKSAWTIVGWESRSEFYKYAEERCYVVDCPCGNHIAYYIIDVKDTKLPDEWSWEKDQYVEYRRTNYRYYTETKFSENELSRLIDRTYNDIMQEEIDSLEFIRLSYDYTIVYNGRTYPNILSAYSYEYCYNSNYRVMYDLLKSKFSTPRFGTMLIHANLNVGGISMGLNGKYDHHIYQIQDMLCRWGYIGELDSDDI